MSRPLPWEKPLAEILAEKPKPLFHIVMLCLIHQLPGSSIPQQILRRAFNHVTRPWRGTVDQYEAQIAKLAERERNG